MTEAKVYLDRSHKAKAERFEKISFLLAGFILLVTAYDRLTSIYPGISLFDYFYLTAFFAGGALNILAGILHEKTKQKKITDKVSRIIFTITGVLLLIDAADKFLLGKIALPSVIMITGICYIFLAVYFKNLKRRRYILVNNEGIEFRNLLFGIKRFKWKDIAMASAEDNLVILQIKTGKKYKLTVSEGQPEFSSFREMLSQHVSRQRGGGVQEQELI